MIARRRLLQAGAVAALAHPAIVRAATPSAIRVGYAAIGVGNRPYAEGTSAATARAGDYLEAEFRDTPDLRIEWYFFKGAGPAVNEALATGQLDFAYQGDLPAIIGRAAGLKTKLLLASGARKPLYLAASRTSDIRSVRDLKGKRVALFRGTNGHLAAIKILADNGLAERDLEVVNLDTAGANAALASGDLDAAFGDTALIELAQQGLARLVYSTKGDNPAYSRQAHVLASEAFEQSQPDITARVVRAFVRAAQYSSIEANRQALLELWGKGGTPIPVLQEFFAGETLAWRGTPLLDDFIIEQYRQQIAASREYRLIRRDVDLTGWFEPRYLNQALDGLGLRDFWISYAADGKPVHPA